MTSPHEKAPRSAATALGAEAHDLHANGQLSLYHLPRRRRKPLIVKAVGPNGHPLVLRAKTAKTLLALVGAAENGITAGEVDSWAFRLAHYIMVLRRTYKLPIPMEWEEHAEGRHGRCFLRSDVTIITILRD